jgi:hypothetical protein
MEPGASAMLATNGLPRLTEPGTEMFVSGRVQSTWNDAEAPAVPRRARVADHLRQRRLQDDFVVAGR